MKVETERRVRARPRVVPTLLSGGVLALLMLAGLGPAAAADETAPITFPEGGQVTVTYGDPWSLRFKIDSSLGAVFSNFRSYVSATVTGDVQAGPTEYFSIDGPASDNTALGWLYSNGALPPTPVGDHSIDLTLSTTAMGPLFEATTTTPARIIVQAAPIALDLRASADEVNPDIVVLSSKLSGDFVDQWSWVPVSSGSAPSFPSMPDGTWAFSVTDSTGAVVAEQTVTRTSGIRSAASVAFADLPRGSTLTARVTYSVDPASAANFTLTQPSDVTFSTTDEPRPLPTASAVPELETPPPGPPGVPLGFVILAAILGAALFAVIVTTLVRARRASVATPSAPTAVVDERDAE